MRMGAPPRPGVVVENSDSLNVPTSPVTSGRAASQQQLAAAATSPLQGGVNVSEIDLSSPLNYGTPSSMGSIRTPRSGIRGTPVRARPDIRTDKRMRQVNIGSDAVRDGRQGLVYETVLFPKVSKDQVKQRRQDVVQVKCKHRATKEENCDPGGPLFKDDG